MACHNCTKLLGVSYIQLTIRIREKVFTGSKYYISLLNPEDVVRGLEVPGIGRNSCDQN